MAQAYLSDKTGDGDVYGVDRLEATQTYVSQIDRVGDDPTAPVRSLVPEGQQHPDTERFGDLRAQRYVPHLTVNPRFWFVDVIYDFPDRRFSFTGWRVHVTFGEETRRVFRDLNGQIVGARAYKSVPTGSVTPYYADTVLGSGRVRLERPVGNVRRREGMDIHVGSTSLILSRTLRSMNVDRLRALEAYSHLINRHKFLAWNRHELLFRHASIREETGPSDQASRGSGSGLVYPTELHFSVRLSNQDEPDGWRYLRLYDAVTDDRGNEAYVMREVPGPDEETTSEPVSTLYKRYWNINFNDILATVEGGSPRSRRIGRVP